MKAYFGFGRMNPLTRGHSRIVDKIMELSRVEGGDPHLFLTRTMNDRNPLSPEDKARFAQRAFPGVTVHLAPTFFDAARQLVEGGYEEAGLVVGEDRVDDFRRKFLPYLGTDTLALKRLEIIGIPRPEGAVSATAARAAARAGDWVEFKSIATGNELLAMDMFQAVRTRMGLCNEFDDLGGDAVRNQGSA